MKSFIELNGGSLECDDVADFKSILKE
jgi:hypothetical protein